MSQSPLVGKTLYSRYQIVQLLGSGGFGDTYLALDLGLPGQPQCVVKHLRPKDPNPAILVKSMARIGYILGLVIQPELKMGRLRLPNLINVNSLRCSNSCR